MKTTRRKTSTRKGPAKAPGFVIAHTIVIIATMLIAGASAFATAIWTQSLGLTGSLTIAAAVFAASLAFLLDMVPVAFAPVWARSGKLMVPGFILLAGFMLVGGAIQVNGVVTLDKAQKAEQIQEAQSRYNEAQVKLDAIVIPERKCLCPQTRAADVEQFDAKRKGPIADRFVAKQDLNRLNEVTLPITEMGIAAMIYQIVAFLIRSMITAVTVRIQSRLSAEYAAEEKRKEKATKAKAKERDAKAEKKTRGTAQNLASSKSHLYLAAANDA